MTTTPFQDLDAVAAFYDERAATHGDTPRAVGWESAHIQTSNFLQMLRLDGLEPGMSVLDLGCGLAHFKDFLDARDFHLDYTGWDISPGLLERARARHPEVRFEARNILIQPPAEPFDFVVCSGALSLRLPDHDAWLVDMIRAMFDACRHGLFFNLLSAVYVRNHILAEEPELFYALPGEVLTLCLGLSQQVLLDHNELAHSFAVYMYKDNEAPMKRVARALELGSTFTDAHEAMLDHYHSFDMHRQLLAYLQTLEPSARLHDHIGLVAFHAEELELEVRAFEQAVALEPDNPRYLEHLAIAYLDQRRAAEAISLLERALETAPDKATIARRLAVARAMLEQDAGNRNT